ncbi:MAG: sporulation stage IV protein A [Ruthenibacterium lactatiformans]
MKLWQSNIFGKSLHELVNEGLQAKLLNMPMPARAKCRRRWSALSTRDVPA